AESATAPGEAGIHPCAWVHCLCSIFIFIRLSRLGSCRHRQFEGEGGALTGPIAVNGQETAYFLCRQGTAVQTEAVPVLFGGESMTENPGQVFLRDSNPVIHHH